MSTHTASADGESITFTDGSMSMADMWTWNWSSITLDRDPLVSFAGGFQNISGMAQDFVFSITTPIISRHRVPRYMAGRRS